MHHPESMAVEVNEVVVLLIALVGYFPVIFAFRRRNETKWLFIAYSALLFGTIATIAENLVYPDAFNYLEHGIGIMGAGILFVLCSYFSYKKIIRLQEDLRSRVGGK